MFQIIAEAIGLAAHATLPRSTPTYFKAPSSARPRPVQSQPVQSQPVLWPRQG
jgi:hypothetical protein